MSSSVNLDTSVLFNYVYVTLPGDIEDDRGSLEIIDSEAYICVIGPAAMGEFEAACERRYDLYGDLLDWLADHPTETIYEYDPTARDLRTSRNDIDHMRYDVQHAWAGESRQKQLSDIRRCQQDLGVLQNRLPDECLDRIYDSLPGNELLFDALTGLDLQHDRSIIVDAVEICREDRVDTLIAIDSDITAPEQREAILEIIRELEGDTMLIEIVDANSILDR